MEQSWRHHGCEIVSVVDDAPPCAAHIARVAIAARAGGIVAKLAIVTLEHLAAADFLQIFVEERRRFDQVTVSVDHGMIEAVAECAYAGNCFDVQACLSLSIDEGPLARCGSRCQAECLCAT